MTIHQAGGLGDGTGSKLGASDEPKDESVDINEGTVLKQRVLDVSKAKYSKSEYESWGDSGDEANIQDTNDDEEESDKEFVHTPDDYVPTDDEVNDKTKDVDEEEYERINEELYGDVNVRLTYTKHNDEEKGDANMIDAALVQVERTQEQRIGKHKESGPEMASIQEKELKELKIVDKSTTVISTIISEVTNVVKEYLELTLDDSLYKKRKPNDDDKDEGPTARLDRGLKRQRTSKGTKTSKKTSTSKDSSKGKSPTTCSKFGKSAKDQVEEPIFVQDSDYAKHD
nr:hypothetical protein [Tanacetum cinerariifolium]